MFITFFVLLATVSFVIGCNLISLVLPQLTMHVTDQAQFNIEMRQYRKDLRQWTVVKEKEDAAWEELFGFHYATFKPHTIKVLKNGSKLCMERDAILGRRARFMSNAEYTKMFPETSFIVDITDLTSDETYQKTFDVFMPENPVWSQSDTSQSNREHILAL